MFANALLRQSICGLPILGHQLRRNPAIFVGNLSTSTVKPWNAQQVSSSNERRVLCIKSLAGLSARGSSTQISEVPPSFARRYFIERVFTLGMFPIFPAALFIHNAVMDYALATTLALHIHWGLEAVVEDYARPFVIGDTLAKASHYVLYVFSVLLFAGLLHFNYTDVGITKAFEMIWSL